MAGEAGAAVGELAQLAQRSMDRLGVGKAPSDILVQPHEVRARAKGAGVLPPDTLREVVLLPQSRRAGSVS